MSAICGKNISVTLQCHQERGCTHLLLKDLLLQLLQLLKLRQPELVIEQ